MIVDYLVNTTLHSVMLPDLDRSSTQNMCANSSDAQACIVRIHALATQMSSPKCTGFDVDIENQCPRIWSLWIGKQGSTTGCHREDADALNFIYVVEGHKQLVMFPPGARTDWEHCDGGYTDDMTCWTSEDVIGNATSLDDAIVVDLHAGQGFFIPYQYWHSAHNVENTIAITLKLDNEFGSIHQVII